MQPNAAKGKLRSSAITIGTVLKFLSRNQTLRFEKYTRSSEIPQTKTQKKKKQNKTKNHAHNRKLYKWVLGKSHFVFQISERNTNDF